jgi:phosphohistidine swiveling domain-containing protein
MDDPTHIPGAPDLHWSTDNVGEALPGVTTPLGWTMWSDTGDRMIRESMFALGIFDRREREQPARLDDRIIQPFHGRVAIRIEWLASVGDRMPGTTGPDAVASMLGRVPDTVAFHPTRRRYPVIAAKLPIAAANAPRHIRALAKQTSAWWRTETTTVASASQAEVTARFQSAYRRFEHIMTAHTIALMSLLTPLLQAVTGLVERTGVGDVGALSGTGGAEMAMIDDIWRTSRGEMSLEDVIAAHGYHGPFEGEISSRVWREEPTPLLRMIEGYSAKPASESPLLREQQARARLPRLQRAVVAELPRLHQPAALALLHYAERTLPLRGVGKASFLQTIDVARACARRAGEHLARAGTLDDPDDVFYLTVPELIGSIPTHAAELVAHRRQTRIAHQRFRLPASWRGTPQPATAERGQLDGAAIVGIGASAGTVEGIVRVVTDPSFADVETGEILVTATTDPSWASILFLAGALVVDIGGMISHAAVVARELGIPCVVNTRIATRALRTGDRVRVNGTNGTVDLLERRPDSG